MNKTDQTYLQRLARGPVSFTFEPNPTGRGTKLVRSTLSSSLQKHYHRLALSGHAAEAVTGCGGHGEPPQTTVTFTLTALGREAIGLHAPPRPEVHRSKALSDEQLAQEGIE